MATKAPAKLYVIEGYSEKSGMSWSIIKSEIGGIYDTVFEHYIDASDPSGFMDDPLSLGFIDQIVKLANEYSLEVIYTDEDPSPDEE
jgi:hypothetical protein